MNRPMIWGSALLALLSHIPFDAHAGDSAWLTEAGLKAQAGEGLYQASNQRPHNGWLGQEVRSPSDALELVTHFKSQWGMDNPHDTLRYQMVSQEGDGVVYVFRQFHRDMPLFDRGVLVRTDGDARVTSVAVHLGNRVGPIPDGPQLTSAETVLLIEARHGAFAYEVEGAELGLFRADGETHLAWRLSLSLETDHFLEATVDANTGEMLQIQQDGPISRRFITLR